MYNNACMYYLFCLCDILFLKHRIFIITLIIYIFLFLETNRCVIYYSALWHFCRWARHFFQLVFKQPEPLC